MGEKVTISNHPAASSADRERRSIYARQLEELAEVRYPDASDDDRSQHAEALGKEFPPVYVHFPWRNLELETLPEAAFLELKTNRNKLLITADEQDILQDTKVSIAGMSVGSSLLYGLVGTGIAADITIADDDTFSTSNLNRVQATVLDVGEQKAAIAARRALEMNPFLRLRVLQKRLNPTNLEEFFYDSKPSVIFEEIDDFRMKVVLREEARTRGIPLIMLTNLGDSVLAEVERYDLDQSTPLFNGNVDEQLIEQIKHEVIDSAMAKQLATALVDKSLVPKRAVQSLQEMGKTLVGRPQLYGTVALDGGIAPYLVRELVLGDKLLSGRYVFNLASVF